MKRPPAPGFVLVATRELRWIVRDRIALFLMVGVALIGAASLSLTFSNAVIRGLNTLIVDADRSPTSLQFVQAIAAAPGIGLHSRADDLSADLLRALLERTGVQPSLVEDIQWGCVKQQGEQGFNIARMASLIAGLPLEVGGTTVNRLCGSSLQALNNTAQSIAAQCEDVQVAGGVEHMSHIPMDLGFDASPPLIEAAAVLWQIALLQSYPSNTTPWIAANVLE